MGVINIIFILTIAVLYLLVQGYRRRLKPFTSLWYAGICVAIGGGLLALAVLPNTTFYGPVLYQAPTQEKVVALTFDDGPYPPYTAQVLKVLADKQVQATFFVVGENARALPHLVQEEQQAGHLIGIHSYEHKDMLRLSSGEIAAQLREAKAVVASITGEEPRYFRPPHGFHDWRVMGAAREANLTVVNWSALGKDWTNPGVDTIVNNVMSRVGPGSIILLHDGDSPHKVSKREQTVAALPILIDRLRSEGYSFVTVDHMLSYVGERK